MNATADDPAKLFTPYNMSILMRTIAGALDPNRRQLFYLLPLAHRFGHLALEPHHLHALHGDAFDELVIIVQPFARRPVSKGLYALQRQIVRFVECPNARVVSMGFHDGAMQENDEFSLLLRSCEGLIYDHNELVRRRGYWTYLTLPDELIEARSSFLRDLGVGNGEPWVTLHVRDASYLPDQTTHAYRCAEIETYRQTIDYLSREGYWIFRLGDEATLPIKDPPPRLVELAHLPDYDTTLDAPLIAGARISINNSSGPEAVSRVLGTPMLLSNSFLDRGGATERTLILPKWFRDLGSGSELSYEEFLARDLHLAHDASVFEANGVEVLDNTPEEILDGVKELIARCDGTFVIDPNLDARFRGLGERKDAEVSEAAEQRASNAGYPHFGPWTNISQTFCAHRERFLTG